MVTRAEQINSAYSKAKGKSPQAVIQKRMNKKLSAPKAKAKPKAKPKPITPKAASAIKKRANKMFDSF